MQKSCCHWSWTPLHLVLPHLLPPHLVVLYTSIPSSHALTLYPSSFLVRGMSMGLVLPIIASASFHFIQSHPISFHLVWFCPFALFNDIMATFLDLQCSVSHQTGPPSPPRALSYTVQQYGQDNVTLTVQWQPPQYDGGNSVSYIITPYTFVSSGTSASVTVPYNVMRNVSIVATNCNGNSSATTATIRIGMCPVQVKVISN